MSPADDCTHRMFVEIELLGRTFGVPLAQLEPLEVNDETEEAVADWRYWVGRGYVF